ncbi:unnamed protein product [Effrenium voratum]|nr:unnamed protein product [Effrenium voratum]
MKKWTHIYFIGIGGIGMSALARWAKHIGKDVAGYDRVSTPLTQRLEQEGMAVHYADDWAQVPEGFTHPEDTLVIITPAIPQLHSEWKHFQGQGFTIMKRSELLGQISQDYSTIAVAGTHGKTSTCSLVAYMLRKMNRSFVAFLGGIAKNFDSNFVIHDGEGETIAVVEADEFDRSFLKLHPNIAVITAVEADHLDTYGTEANLVSAFAQFVGQITASGGVVIAQEAIKGLSNTASYGIQHGDFRLDVEKLESGITFFSFYHKQEKRLQSTISLFGLHNMENLCGALSAISSADQAGLAMLDDLTGYKAVKRRMEKHVDTPGLIYIDDYAHHPTEIDALVDAVKTAYEGWRIHAIFQPHLFSRTRDFQEAFGKSLSKADSVRLLPIYPAREEPMEGVDSTLILNKVTTTDRAIMDKAKVLAYVDAIQQGVILTVGAGDIDQCVQPIVQSLNQRP